MIFINISVSLYICSTLDELFIVVDAVDGAGFVDVVLNYLLLLVLLVVSGLLMLLFGDLGRS